MIGFQNANASGQFGSSRDSLSDSSGYVDDSLESHHNGSAVL
jgi:hypothetical protein